MEDKIYTKFKENYDVSFFNNLKVIKRDSTIVDFDVYRTLNSISKAMYATNKFKEQTLFKVLKRVLDTVKKLYSEKNPSVEDIQDIIEVSLMRSSLFEVAKAFIIYREEKFKRRKEKQDILNKVQLDEVDKKFSVNSLRVMASRHLNKDLEGKIIESPKDVFIRVAIVSSLSEVIYDPRVYKKVNTQMNVVKAGDSLEKNDDIYCEVEFDITQQNLDLARTFLKYCNTAKEYEDKFSIGKYKLNEFHFERLMSTLTNEALNGRLKVDANRFLEMLENHEFDNHEKFIDLLIENMSEQNFMPCTPILTNSGRKLGMLSACFTINMDDSMPSIMKAASDIAMVQKSGGGTGVNFSKLRPSNDPVASTKGVSSGPISFMKMIDAVTDVIKQGGVRRGANMGILDINHPDIDEFIRVKEEDGTLSNFNISVGLLGDFWQNYYNDEPYWLINPKTKKQVKTIDARETIDRLSYYAWLRADPGVLFFDKINERNVLKKAKGMIKVTNPCGEEPLYEYESCNLSSINVANFVRDGMFDWEKFDKLIPVVARELENSISVNDYPIKEIDYNTKQTRRIGVGLMGVAKAMYMLKIKFNSAKGLDFMKRLSEHLTYYAFKESVKIAQERGPFPLYEKSDYVNGDLPIEGFYHPEEWTLNWNELASDIKKYGVRNAMVTTMPPTGSVSMVADTSSGIEPNFALVFEKRVTVGSFFYTDEIFEKELKERGLYSEELLKKIADNRGSLLGLDEIPKDMKELYVTSMDMHWLDHVVSQAILQRWTTDSISKTINMASDVTSDDVKYAYLISHELGCKGITVYRDGSKFSQVLNVNGNSKEESFKLKPSKSSIKLLKLACEENPKFSDMIAFDKITQDENNIDLNLFLNSNQEKTHNKESEKKSENHVAKMTIKKVSTDEDIDKEKCPVCGDRVIMEAGCKTCHSCGWSACTIS